MSESNPDSLAARPRAVRVAADGVRRNAAGHAVDSDGRPLRFGRDFDPWIGERVGRAWAAAYALLVAENDYDWMWKRQPGAWVRKADVLDGMVEAGPIAYGTALWTLRLGVRAGALEQTGARTTYSDTAWVRLTADAPRRWAAPHGPYAPPTQRTAGYVPYAERAPIAFDPADWAGERRVEAVPKRESTGHRSENLRSRSRAREANPQNDQDSLVEPENRPQPPAGPPDYGMPGTPLPERW